MYKMVACEFNRTLINSEEAISTSTMIEIDKLRRDKGIVFTVMTNELPDYVLDYNADFPFIDYIVGYNGAYIYDAVNEKCIFKKSIGISIIKKVYRLFNDLDLCFYTSQYGAYWGNYREKYYCSVITDFNKFSDVHRGDVFKIAIICSNKKEVDRVFKALDDYDVNVDVRILKKNGKIFIELLSKLNSKMNGLHRICRIKKISYEEILAIVCSDTDLCVMDKVGKSVAIGGCCDKVRRVATEFTGTNEEKGVEQVLKKYM